MRLDTIARARAPRHLAGSARLRQGLEGWLADCDPARHGLPPGSIVLVRRLRTRWSDLQAGEHSRRYGEFEALLAGARRPGAGDTADDAEAVWFADEAELLACMARDALAGVLRLRWWWRTLAPAAPDGMPAAASFGMSAGLFAGIAAGAANGPGVAHWLAAPRHVPCAVQRLGGPATTQWFARWTAGERATLVRALSQTYAIAIPVVDWVLAGSVAQAVDGGGPVASPSRAAPTPDAPPASAGAPAARLRQLCADLAADPGAARSASTAPAMAARLAPYAAPAQTVAPPIHRAADAPPQPATPAGPPAQPTTPHAQPRAPAPAPSPDAPRAVPAALPDATVDPARTATAPVPPAPATPALPPAPPIDDDWAALSLPIVFRTRYGGLLFLLNAALQLSLYGDFSMPAQRGLPCSPWRLLLLAGRAWCGRGFRGDPLAAWLARRDSPATMSDIEIDIDGDWRIDPSWLAPFEQRRAAAAPWRAVWQDGRLRLRHPAGFLVCDVAAGSAACEALLADELRRLPLAEPPRIVRGVVAHAPRARRSAQRRRHDCPHQLWSYLHARLALALEDGFADGGSANGKRLRIAAMLALPARLQESAERVDLRFALAGLPLAVRMAGLDRDPGWIPAAGRDVRFHFG